MFVEMNKYTPNISIEYLIANNTNVINITTIILQ